MMPDVPTFAEAGIAIDVSVWIGIAAPAGTPAPVVERLNAEFNKALAAPDVRAKLATLGVDPVGGTSAAFTQFVKERRGALGEDHQDRQRQDRVVMCRRAAPRHSPPGGAARSDARGDHASAAGEARDARMRVVAP